jgi:PTH1 family peptidyl-tRNA hydrolase
MYLIVGLGNPEPEYSMTRHNMGFDVINKLSKKYDIKVEKKKFDALIGSGEIEGEKVILFKPQTFMNESGQALRKVMDFYKLHTSDIIIIYDDIDLPECTVKIRKKGGAGNHNGMKSVVEVLEDLDFARVRIGTGQPEFKELLISHVIGKMSEEQYKVLEPAIDKATLATIDIIKYGVDKAMNLNN